jgi:regulator of cell morphogenesis and NO signaling
MPPNACINYRASILTLKEIDNDLVQHLHLENNILFPKAIEMEKYSWRKINLITVPNF